MDKAGAERDRAFAVAKALKRIPCRLFTLTAVTCSCTFKDKKMRGHACARPSKERTNVCHGIGFAF
jgi:hypothetical protein